MSFAAASAEVVRRTIEMAAVPAPTFHERRRAELISAWWDDKGLAPTTDAAGNVWARVRGGAGPALVVCAHLDTVFGEEISHVTRVEGERLIGPSVGDDSVALAALTVLTDLLPPCGGETWLLATVAEEGVGNLTGIRHGLAHSPVEIGELVAVEGNYLGRVVARGVGSVRWRVVFDGPGGHAWESADQPSAVHELARVVTALDGLAESPGFSGRRALNVGTISGGEAINARARRAVMSVDIRADEGHVLQELEERARDLIDETSRVSVTYQEIGRRPAGSIPSTHPLVMAASEALSSVGLEPVLDSASTDANAAYEQGIPAITIGITRGGREHTEQEWIETEPIQTGLEAITRTTRNVWDEHR